MPVNAGKPWAKENDDLPVNLYRSGASQKDVCKTLRGTEAEIAAILIYLGIIKNRNIFRCRK